MGATRTTAVQPVAAPFPGLTGSALSDFAVPVFVLAIVTALVTPLPSVVLDFLLVTDIMMSVIVLMVAMYIRRPVEFNVFPSTLLLLTLFRLALNISSSRLILLNGNTGTAAAGRVIEAFGSFVVGGNYIIGTVIFLVLIAIQYVVINHGAVRISEVTARFTLDALPGKQMAIDADLNAGLVDEAGARARRKELAAEAEFYGAMDGASRFTQRDAVASILITGINIIAGFLIGVLQHDMDLTKALQTYTVLTIGDGLVTVIPALMISVSGGLVITRAGSSDRVGAEFQRQLFGHAEPLMLSAGVLAAMSLFPGLPTVPFLLMGGGLGVTAWSIRRKVDTTAVESTTAAKTLPKDDVEGLLRVEPLTLELGLGLGPYVEGSNNSPLLRRIGAIRAQLASQLGYVLPPVRVNDNVGRRSQEYVILLRGIEVARYELLPGHELGIPTGAANPALQGKPTTEPAFGLSAFWIPKERVAAARRSGYTVVDAVSVIGTHLTEVVKRSAHELFTRQDAKSFCDRASQDNPKAVEDLVPKLLSLAVVQRVLQNLLRERVSIRDTVAIVEALGEAATITRNPVVLTEYVRQAMRRALVKPSLNQKGELAAHFVDPGLERTIEKAVEHGEHNSCLTLSPEAIRDIQVRIGRALKDAESDAVIITTSGARYFVRQILEASHGAVTILSHNEIPAGVRVISLGDIG